MKPRDYCCCAIPVMNAGIYATLFEQFLLALLVAILAVATPSLVGAAVPGFAAWILAIICFVLAGVQLIGFLGVFKERAIMFRRYTTIHILLTVAAFAVALTWIIISATRHSTAVSDCETDFFSNTTTSTSNSSDVPTFDEGGTLCNIFTWVDVGLMGGLWVVLAIMQFYLYTVISSYGTGQRRDHEKYNSLYSVADIPLSTNRGDPWDARPSLDDSPRGNYVAAHQRNDSSASVSTILAEKAQEPRSFDYSDAAPVPSGSVATGYPPQRKGTYASTRMGSVDDRDGYLSHPSTAYTQEPQPTPHSYEPYPSYGYGNNVEAPIKSQPHPAEGMFGRKGSRLQKPDRRDF